MAVATSVRKASGGDVALLDVLTVRVGAGVAVGVGVTVAVEVGVPAGRATIVVAAGSGIIDIDGTLLRRLATAAAVAALASR